MWHQWHQITPISTAAAPQPNNAVDSKEALRRAAICLTPKTEEVEEMEMSCKHEGRAEVVIEDPAVSTLKFISRFLTDKKQ